MSATKAQDKINFQVSPAYRGGFSAGVITPLDNSLSLDLNLHVGTSIGHITGDIPLELGLLASGSLSVQVTEFNSNNLNDTKVNAIAGIGVQPYIDIPVPGGIPISFLVRAGPKLFWEADESIVSGNSDLRYTGLGFSGAAAVELFGFLDFGVGVEAAPNTTLFTLGIGLGLY